MKKENPLKVKRKESLAINREEIAKKIGISFYTVVDYENGRRTPNAKELISTLRYGYEMNDKQIIEYLEYLHELKERDNGDGK